MAINPIKAALVVGTVGGGAGSLALAERVNGREVDAKLGTYSAGAAGAVGGGFVGGKYLGPQIKWTLAERAMKKMHNRQLLVAADLKSGRILKYDQVKYLQESADIVNKAKSSLLSAAAPKQLIVGLMAGVGAAALGTGLVLAANALNE